MRGTEVKVKGSYCNKAEQTCVLELIDKLLKIELKNTCGQKRQMDETDIGVVSPYRQQCTMLTKCLEAKKMDKITVGSAETFQGQERLVIIISTVRSSGELGFVSDKRVCTYKHKL